MRLWSVVKNQRRETVVAVEKLRSRCAFMAFRPSRSPRRAI